MSPQGPTPAASSEAARKRMMSTKRRDTPAELALRSSLHRLGLRFRVDVSPLRGSRRRADIVFPSARIAVFIDGCFWHGCPEHGTQPKQNAAWWLEKLERNRLRDADTNRQLEDAGWFVLRYWEHEDAGVAAATIRDTVTARLAVSASS